MGTYCEWENLITHGITSKRPTAAEFCFALIQFHNQTPRPNSIESPNVVISLNEIEKLETERKHQIKTAWLTSSSWMEGVIRNSRD